MSTTPMPEIDNLIRSALPVKPLRSGGPIPARAHTWDAGLDLTAANDLPIWVKPGEIACIPTELATAIPPGAFGLIAGRSGLAARDGIVLANGIGVIDAGYRGEIRILLTKISEDPDEWHKITRGDRIAQLIVLPLLLPSPIPVTHLPSDPDGRGTAGFGSTGRTS